MIDDYSLFGDVVIFDTTFCTNKENKLLGVFVGFNHHKGATIFGASLLYDETGDSFIWLFETFLKAHGQKKPKTIFTDQDVAMSKALAQVLPDTWHDLCTWHILQNGINHHGYLMREKSSKFLRDFRRCMYEYEDVDEFEDAWKQLYCDDRVINKYWLDRIYKLKNKWAKCYMKEAFTLGVRSTQPSESLNSDLKDFLKPRMDLNQFLVQFERVLKSKRDNELKAEFKSKNTLPRLLGFKSHILAQAVKVYTPFMYNLFLEEYKWIALLSVKKSYEMEHESLFVVCVTNEEGDSIGRDFTIRFQKVGPLIACSCRHFETDGILCRHALKVIDRLDIKRISETYIHSRWTRAARSVVVEEDRTRVPFIDDPHMDHSQRYRDLCPKYLKLLNHASTSEKGYEYATNAYDMLSRQIASISIDERSTEGSVQFVPAPQKAVELKIKEKHKGSIKRKQPWQQRGGKGNKGQNSDQVQPTPTQNETQIHLSQPMVNHTSFTGLLVGQQSSQASSETPYAYGLE